MQAVERTSEKTVLGEQENDYLVSLASLRIHRLSNTIREPPSKARQSALSSLQ